MQYRAVLGHVDLLSREHRRNPGLQVGFFGELHQEPHGLVGDPVLGIVEEKTRGLGRKALATIGLVGKKLAKVNRGQLLVMGRQCLVRRQLGQGFVAHDWAP